MVHPLAYPSPSATAGSAHSVTIRIDQLKELTLGDIMAVFAEGVRVVAARAQERPGGRRRAAQAHETAQVIQDGRDAVVLKLWRLDRDPARSQTSASGTASSGSHRKGKKARAHGGGGAVAAAAAAARAAAAPGAASRDQRWSLR